MEIAILASIGLLAAAGFVGFLTIMLYIRRLSGHTAEFAILTHADLVAQRDALVAIGEVLKNNEARTDSLVSATKLLAEAMIRMEENTRVVEVFATSSGEGLN